jgi:hypothetical protein
MIDWEAARKKLTLEYCYDHFPDVRKIVDEEFAVEAAVETESTYPPGFDYGQTDESTPDVVIPEEPIVEPVVVVEDSKIYLSDYITPIDIPKYGKFGFSTVRMDEDNEPWNFQGATNRYYGTLTKVRQKEYVRLEKTYVDVLRVVVEHFNARYQGNKLVAGDCSALSGDHSYHNTKYFHTIDINYFTYGRNLTHYRLNGDFPLEIIWLDDYPTVIDETVFDGKRNYDFFKMIHEVFPSSNIMVGTDIKNYLKRFGDVSFLHPGEDEPYWNHKIHAHIVLGLDVNWEYLLVA